MLSSGEVLSLYSSPYLAGQTVDTQLTTNCNALTQATFDLNDTTWVTFYFQNNVPLWKTLLSIGIPRVMLVKPVTGCGITLTEGLEITMNAMSTVYTMWLTGTIIDTGKSYNFDGLFLGSFSRGAEMKSAVQLIRLGRYGTSSALQFQDEY